MVTLLQLKTLVECTYLPLSPLEVPFEEADRGVKRRVVDRVGEKGLARIGSMRLIRVSTKPSGFKAMVFQHEDERIIAFCGTDFLHEPIKDLLLTDLNLVLGKRPIDELEQMQDALDFIDDLEPWEGETILTGHSLGGTIVQYLFARRPDLKNLARGITFNPGGISHFIEENAYDHYPIVNYVIDGDLVGDFSSMLADIESAKRRILGFITESDNQTMPRLLQREVDQLAKRLATARLDGSYRHLGEVVKFKLPNKTIRRHALSQFDRFLVEEEGGEPGSYTG